MKSESLQDPIQTMLIQYIFTWIGTGTKTYIQTPNSPTTIFVYLDQGL